ncbi:rhomboid family intramembrane serine protease [Actinomadura kijaniata]|uniref:Membrane associated rhomboid family serine protease n=1 Tax=Actinomadura namibiensis TaxID=182080 RepID=A0A7W3LL09_ACTNM|nr:rhomboid family intramembrane serine protease [Actinomadura namibiensis]MBA8950064.1 membrane associated rhomboid family serine protease [Actinomadura namibiensis]
MSYSPVPERQRHSDGLLTHGARALTGALLVTAVTAVMWVLEFVDAATGGSLDRFGIQPHDVDDLPDILTAPFLHVGFGHLMSNTVPFLILGFLAAARGVGKFLAASLFVIVVGGLGVWFTGPVNTLGASILVFGFFGYLVGRGVFERHLLDILIAVAVVVLYGTTMLFGLLPSDPSISWQGHLFGLLGGLLASWVLRRRAR